jgi:site-specific DNA-methyltransferase (adenine-specific)
MSYQILHGNNLDVLPTLADNSIDSIVTDPPYELGFMGKKWDSSGIAYSVELWTECLRVLKPGGHLLAFSGSRTYHRMVVAIEDAGFEIRDMISWISNKTFPKSLNIGKAIDKAAGAKREIIGTNLNVVRESKVAGGSDFGGFTQANSDITAPATDEAKQWDGWGTGLKPTVEPIVMARKPLEGTVANNVLSYGTGGLNIDGSRIGTEQRTNNYAGRSVALTQERSDVAAGIFAGNGDGSTTVQGRWPANLILDEDTAELLDEQSGVSKDGVAVKRNRNTAEIELSYQGGWRKSNIDQGFSGLGGASRFFYVAKASKRDRNEGLEGLPEQVGAKQFNQGMEGKQRSDGSVIKEAPSQTNFHPTVKPTSLMEYLIKLVTPPNGTVLDPFTGSGSTGKAAILQGFDFIGIEMTEEYLPIIEARLKHAEATSKKANGGLF